MLRDDDFLDKLADSLDGMEVSESSEDSESSRSEATELEEQSAGQQDDSGSEADSMDTPIDLPDHADPLGRDSEDSRKHSRN